MCCGILNDSYAATVSADSCAKGFKLILGEFSDAT